MNAAMEMSKGDAAEQTQNYRLLQSEIELKVKETKARDNLNHWLKKAKS